MKKYALLVLLISNFQHYNSTEIRRAVHKLSKEENRTGNGALYQQFLKYGVSSFPYLIKDIDKKSKNYIGFSRPLNSNLKILVNYDGVFEAYMIEFILGTIKLNDADIKQDKHMLFTRNIIIKSGDSADLKYADIINIKMIYSNWWEHNKNKSIEELRKDWANNKRPLSGSKYRWY